MELELNKNWSAVLNPFRTAVPLRGKLVGIRVELSPPQNGSAVLNPFRAAVPLTAVPLWGKLLGIRDKLSSPKNGSAVLITLFEPRSRLGTNCLELELNCPPPTNGSAFLTLIEPQFCFGEN